MSTPVTMTGTQQTRSMSRGRSFICAKSPPSTATMVAKGTQYKKRFSKIGDAKITAHEMTMAMRLGGRISEAKREREREHMHIKWERGRASWGREKGSGKGWMDYG